MGKRIRRVVGDIAGKSSIEKRLKDNANKGVGLQDRILELQAELVSLGNESMDLFNMISKTKVFGDDLNTVEKITPVSRATSVIDPQVFFDQFGEDDRENFFFAVKVGITKAAEVLPGKVLTKIKETTPGGVPKDPVIKFYRNKPSK